MSKLGQDTLNTRKTLTVGNKKYAYYSIPHAEEAGMKGINRLPFSLKVLFENLLRYEDGTTVTTDDIQAIATWLNNKKNSHEIAYRPARVLMQDFTGVPAIVDLAAMRDAMKNSGGNPEKINPLSPVDLVIDHSVQVDTFGNPNALEANVQLEMERNKERYEFLSWGSKAFDNFRVVPPGTGICHQVNLEYLAKSVWTKTVDGEVLAYPDTLVGTDSHTTMINALGVLGWGVGGIEAEAAMLGQPISMLIPEVVGFKLTGKLQEGITATDLVLTVTQLLRQKGVVGKFVEFFGPGLSELPLADRATISNMAPEYGATCGFFPIDAETIKYLQLTNRDEETLQLVESYCKAQGLWHDKNTPDPEFTDTVALDLSTVEPCMAGPKRPQDRVNLNSIPKAMDQMLKSLGKNNEKETDFPAEGTNFSMHHGDVVIAAITSCTNTSNPSVLMAAGLVAKNACEKGLQVKPWVKTSLAPGSKVVTDYLQQAGLQQYLDQCGFGLVGYGCTTCIGNSGPLPDAVANTISKNNLVVAGVLSGNRNFEGRIHAQVQANWLASPPLVVAYALAGTTMIDLTKDPLGSNAQGEPIYLKDIWPSNHEIASEVGKVKQAMFKEQYADVFKGDAAWQSINVADSKTYDWQSQSTYVQHPTFFQNLSANVDNVSNISNARILAILGDSVTTDHISPAGAIKADSPAGRYLSAHHVDESDFNSYGSRRGNHEVMMRGTFANIRIRNEMVPNTEGGYTKHYASDEVKPIYDIAMQYQQENTPLVMIGGSDYGMGSSRDWAAKGTLLLGVKAVITESYERIHRSNLIGMGVLPLQFKSGTTRKTLKLDGSEVLNITNLDKGLKPGMDVTLTIQRNDGSTKEVSLLCRIDTENEVNYYKNGGILHYVLRNMQKTV